MTALTTTPRQHAEVLRKVRSWLSEAGSPTATVDRPEEGVAHHLTFNFPPKGPTTFHLVRVKDRPLTILATGTTVAPQHLQALEIAPPDLRQQVMKVLRRVGFQGGVVGFAPKTNGEIVTNWQMDVEIFDDALSQESFFRGIRALLSKHLEVIDAFVDALGSKVVDAGVSSSGSASYIR